MQTLLNQLDLLESTGLVRQAQVEPEAAYLFRHTLIQDVAYNSLLLSDRRRLHQAISEAIKRVHHLDDEFAAILAHHFKRAEVHDEALLYFERAGEHAKLRYANEETINFYQAAEEGHADSVVESHLKQVVAAAEQMHFL